MTGAKLGALVTTALLVMYLAILGQRGIMLLNDTLLISKLMGGFILVLPLVALWGIMRELIFGLKIEKLAKQIEQEGAWPEFNFELRPSGRPVRASADAEFDRFKEAAQAHPEDFHVWFNLGLAYDATGDRRRARAAMRKALDLSNKTT
jgi:tetratricopeptide (TPR) repeat protein